MRVSYDFKDYECIDAGNGEKLERWKNVILRRPDPQAMWYTLKDSKWDNIDGFYHRSKKGGGYWEFKTKLDEYWTVEYKGLVFKVSPTGFKHTGLFPEQAVNWDFMMDKIKNAGREINVLNLFAYTGGASVACLSAGAKVVHVDSSKGMVAWAKENVVSSGLQDRPIRFLVDDVNKFVAREIRRGNKYDAIIMDPPSYGRGANGEVWQFEDSISGLVENCMQIIYDKPLFFLINSYTTGISSQVLQNMLMLEAEKANKLKNGKFYNGEIGLPMTNSKLVLPCGIYCRWEEN